MAESVDTSFHTLDSLRSFTTAPVVASIRRIVIDSDTRRARRRFQLGATGTTVAIVLIVGITYFFTHGNEALVRW